MGFDPLIEMSHDATREASKALSKLVNVPVSLGTVQASVHDRVSFFASTNPTELVYATSSSIVGDATGLALLCLPLSTACGLCDLLFKREPGATHVITLEEEDALLEMGNIVVGNYLRSFARAVPTMTLVHKAASLVCDTPKSLATHVLTAWELAGAQDTMIFEVAFQFRHASLAGFVVILLKASPLRSLLDQFLTATAAVSADEHDAPAVKT